MVYIKGQKAWNKGIAGYSTKWKGRHHTENAKRKMSNSAKERVKRLGIPFKGMKHTEESKKKIGLKSIGRKPMLGKHLSREAKLKISKANKGRLKGIKFTDEHRLKIGIANKGKKRTEEYKIKSSRLRKGLHFSPKTEFKKGNIPWMKGRVGNKHPNWKGGISFEPYSIDWTETLRRSIRERDNYVCQICNQYEDA